MKLIYHMVNHRTYTELAGCEYYSPESLETEGFIHCSYMHQLCEIANEFYRQEKDLYLLEIDASLLDCRIIDEDLCDRGQKYPHIYGRLPLTAVITSYLMEKNKYGDFILPTMKVVKKDPMP